MTADICGFKAEILSGHASPLYYGINLKTTLKRFET
jgi:hypothetical protein